VCVVKVMHLWDAERPVEWCIGETRGMVGVVGGLE
jgi:hypothetical protein